MQNLFMTKNIITSFVWSHTNWISTTLNANENTWPVKWRRHKNMHSKQVVLYSIRKKKLLFIYFNIFWNLFIFNIFNKPCEILLIFQYLSTNSINRGETRNWRLVQLLCTFSEFWSIKRVKNVILFIFVIKIDVLDGI